MCILLMNTMSRRAASFVRLPEGRGLGGFGGQFHPERDSRYQNPVCEK